MPVFQKQEIDTIQIVERDGPVVAQGVARRAGEPERVLREAQRFQALCVIGKGDQRHVDLPRAQAVDQARRQILAQVKRQLGIIRLEQRHGLRQDEGADGGNDAETENTGQGRFTPRRAHHVLGQRQQFLALAQQGLADGCQAEGTARAIDKGRAEDVFQFLDGGGQCRLRDKAVFRRPRKALAARKGDEKLQLPKGW